MNNRILDGDPWNTNCFTPSRISNCDVREESSRGHEKVIEESNVGQIAATIKEQNERIRKFFVLD